jgi:hypothetical protein
MDGEGFSWECPDSFELDSHQRGQYERMPNPGFPTVIKFVSPWFCRTAPGYSIRMLPLFYHFDQLWRALPGVIQSDVVHVTHVNVLFEFSKGQIVLPRGTPLVQIVPFRRERYDLDLHVASSEDLENMEATARQALSLFHNDSYPRAKGTT